MIHATIHPKKTRRAHKFEAHDRKTLQIQEVSCHPLEEGNVRAFGVQFHDSAVLSYLPYQVRHQVEQDP